MNETESSDVLNAVVFPAGGWRVGFEARSVRGARPVGESAATVHDAHVEALLGLPSENTPAFSAQWLEIKHPTESRKILVAGPVELLALPIASIHSLPPLLAARTSLNGLRALVLQGNTDKLVLLFDVPPEPSPD